MARWAVGLAAAVVVVIVVSYAMLAVAYAIGGDDAISDTWIGYLAGYSLIGGLLASLVALALAVVAKSTHERWTLLWLPLSVFPALFATVVLLETLWIE
ncbi:MAG: hypothetical protein IPM45_00635 [Acidimicrobiales bacterium]|nr:hypothetical protein [Acidimicrobiales bacterium]